MSLNLLIAITLVCWGIWGIFDKKALEGSCHRDVLLMLYLLFIPVVPAVGLLLNHLYPGWQPSWPLVAWTGLAAVTYTIAMVTYITALSQTEASFVLGITASYPLLLQFMAVPLLGESIVWNRLAGAALVGLGVTAIGGSGREQRAILTGRSRKVIICCVAAASICWGIYGVFDKKAVSIAPPLAVYFCQCLWDVVLLVFLWLYFRRQGHTPRLTCPRTWRFCALSTISLLIGAWTYLTALAQSTASYVIAITGCYPLLMYLFAILLLKEQFNSARLVGIILVVAGGILVQFTQSTS